MKIQGFRGEYCWLSNFWSADVVYEGRVYPTVEHAYVAAKTTDLEARRRIQWTKSPGEVKRLGRLLTLRPDWESIKVATMHELLREKFKNDDLKKRLLDTGDTHIEETNTWNDTFWGVCQGQGRNTLGHLIMIVRDEIKMEQVNE